MSYHLQAFNVEKKNIKMENWDAYDNCFKKIDNVTLIRENTILQGYYHLVCDIIVKHLDVTYLIMQRD